MTKNDGDFSIPNWNWMALGHPNTNPNPDWDRLRIWT